MEGLSRLLGSRWPAVFAALAMILCTLALSVSTGGGVDLPYLALALVTATGPASVALAFGGGVPSANLRAALLGFGAFLSLLFGIGQWRNLSPLSLPGEPELDYVEATPSLPPLIGAMGLILIGLVVLLALVRMVWRSHTRSTAMLAGLTGTVVAVLWRYLVPLIALQLIAGPDS